MLMSSVQLPGALTVMLMPSVQSRSPLLSSSRTKTREMRGTCLMTPAEAASVTRVWMSHCLLVDT